MDTGEGRFKLFENIETLEAAMEEFQKQHPKFGGTFQQGEIVELKGSRFEIIEITEKELRLRLLPKVEWVSNE